MNCFCLLRRQQNDDERLTEDQLVERQKKFAKASLERYFTSLENVYTPTAQVSQTEKIIEEQQEEVTMANDMELESLTSDRNYRENPSEPQAEVNAEPKTVVDDVVSTAFTFDDKEVLQDKSGPGDSKGKGCGYNPYVYGFVDFTESFIMDPNTARSEDAEQDIDKPMGSHIPESNKCDADEQTLVESAANTDLTLKAGGITDRLNDLGIEVSHSKSVNDKSAKVENKKNDSKKNAKKGKVLIVCPECEGLNKEYMSWCTHCGEMIIGVEPMLVSKNKEGKIRTKPIEKTDGVADKLEDKSSKDLNNIVSTNYEQETFEKPFTLNLDAIKSAEKEDDEGNVSKNCSPNKSDGKDSGRPSSGDVDLEVEKQKIEEEVVNDICALIADPVVKGIVKSHFDKGKQVQQENTVSREKQLERDSNRLANNLGVTEQAEKVVLDKEFDIYCSNSNKKQECEPCNSVQERVAMFNKKSTNIGSIPEDSENKNKLSTSVKGYSAVQNKKYSLEKKNKNSDVKGSKPLNLTSDVDDELFAPPPVPYFSEALPVSHSELALKLPANSMDFSTDVSQIVSQNFEQSDTINQGAKTDSNKLSKEERKRERRRKKGHGAIDVEVFGYEESRESRNSSRANRMVPLLNLGGKNCFFNL